jgi:preprotein translocase SecE subunit
MSKALTKKSNEVAADNSGESLITRLRNFFIELKYEWQKVTTPQKKEWRQSTLVVFTFVILLSLFLFLCQLVVSSFFNKVVY